MFNLYIYGILGLIIAALLGGFYFYYNSSQKEKALLIEQKAKLELSVELQDKTINQLKNKFNIMQESNAKLADDLAQAEEKAAQEKMQASDEKDTDGLNEQEIEKKINEDYSRNNRDLESIH